MSISVEIEVTEEITQTSTGKQQQVVFVDVGDRYPIKDSIWVNDQPLSPGVYLAKRIYRKGYDFVLDINNLQPAPAPVPAKKAS